MSSVTLAIEQGPRSYQEDYYLSMPIKGNGLNGRLLAIMDGHGGKAVAEICAREIGNLFSPYKDTSPEESLRQLVSKLNSKTVSFRDVGATLSIAFVLEDQRKVSIAIVGDSPVVVLDGKKKLHLSPEHNVRSNAQERRAAELRGGICEGGYLFAKNSDHGLQISRSLGDAHLGGILSREPDIYTIDDPQWILVASDGLFDPGHRDTHKLLGDIQRYAILRSTARDLMKWAEKRGLKDNATALVWCL